MDEYELQETTRKLMEDLSVLPKMLSMIEKKSGNLTDEENAILLSNLCELQDSIIVLSEDRTGYFENICGSLFQFNTDANRILKKIKHVFPLQEILRRTCERISVYLMGIPRYKTYYKEFNSPKEEMSLNKEVELRIGELADQLLLEISQEISIEELSKNVMKISTRKADLVELSKEKAQEINEKLDVGVSAIILDYNRKRGR